MDKILIAGETDGFSKMVVAELFNQYDICSCEFSFPVIQRTVKIQKPVAILSFKSASATANNYKAIKEEFPEIGIVAVCDENDATLDKTQVVGFVALKQPVEVNDILEAIKTVIADSKKDAKQKSILAIDDNAMVLRNIKEMIGKEYSVFFTTSGKKALEFLSVKKVDLILLDYEMPVMSGSEVIKGIRSNPDLKDIPVVFLTGVADKSKIQDVIPYNPEGYMLKPIDADKLKATVKEIIGE